MVVPMYFFQGIKMSFSHKMRPDQTITKKKKKKFSGNVYNYNINRSNEKPLLNVSLSERVLRNQKKALNFKLFFFA